MAAFIFTTCIRMPAETKIFLEYFLTTEILEEGALIKYEPHDP